MESINTASAGVDILFSCHRFCLALLNLLLCNIVLVMKLWAGLHFPILLFRFESRLIYSHVRFSLSFARLCAVVRFFIYLSQILLHFSSALKCTFHLFVVNASISTSESSSVLSLFIPFSLDLFPANLVTHFPFL